MNLQIINGITPVSEIKDGDHVVVDNVVRKVENARWNRVCGWYEVIFEGEREYEVVHNSEQNFHTVHMVITL